MLQGLYQLKVTLTDVEYDMREMDLRSVWGNYLWNAATVSKPVFACAHAQVRADTHTHLGVNVCVCEYACPCMIGCAYMPHSAGGIGHENSLQKLLQQTGTNSWMWDSAECFVGVFFPSDHTGIVLLQSQNPNPWFLHSYISNVILS